MSSNGKVLVDIRDDILFVETENYPLLLTKHRSFFEIALGFDRDPDKKRYILSDKRKINSALTETVSFLKDENIDFELGEGATVLVDKTRASYVHFQESKTTGLNVKRGDYTLPSIPNFVRKLQPYQECSVAHLLTVGNGANFSVPGSGKTTIAYAVYAILKERKEVEKILVIGPRSCFQPWEEEYLQCFNISPKGARLAGNLSGRMLIYTNSNNYELFLSTYNTASNDIPYLIDLCKRHRMLVVLDESHYVKRFKGGIWAPTVLDLAEHATRRIILSGTPAPNDFLDLWTQITFLWPEKYVLGEKEQFEALSESNNAAELIQELISPFFVRIAKETLSLPKPHFNVIDVPMAPIQKRIYSTLAIKTLEELQHPPEDRRQLRQWRKAKMVRLIQASTNPSLLARYSEEFRVPPLSDEGISILQMIDRYPEFEVPGKITKLLEMISAFMQENKKVIVWTNFIFNIRMLEKKFQELGIAYARVYGAVPKDDTESIEDNREKEIKRFKETSSPMVLLANPQACAESISLHKICHDAIYLDRTFNCGLYMQSLDRIHRIGLKKDENVYYHLLVTDGSIDQVVHTRLLEKQRNMEELLSEKIVVGSLETDEGELEASEADEKKDFEEVCTDLKRHFRKVDGNGD